MGQKSLPKRPPWIRRRGFGCVSLPLRKAGVGVCGEPRGLRGPTWTLLGRAGGLSLPRARPLHLPGRGRRGGGSGRPSGGGWLAAGPC